MRTMKRLKATGFSQGLDRMKQYLTTEADLAPFKEMILWKNARNLFPSLK